MSIDFITNDTEAQEAVHSAQAKTLQEQGMNADQAEELIDTAKPESEKPRLRLVPASELVSNRTAEPYLIKGWLPLRGTGWVFGPPGSGKSFVVLDAGCHIAAGMDWRGHRVKQGPVVILAGEGIGGMRMRIAAWMQAHPQVDELPVYVSDRGGSLSADGLGDVFQAIDALPESPVLIIIDTQSRWQAGNENSSEDGAAYVNAVDALRDRYACYVQSVHHTGKDIARGSRGWSGYLGAADAEAAVTAIDVEGVKHITLKCTKIKEGSEPPPLHWELVSTVLDGWRDVDGDPVQSAYLVEEDEPPKASGGRNRKDVPPDEIKRLVNEYPHSGKRELSGIMADRFKVSEKTAKTRLNELEGLGVLIPHSGPGGRVTYTIGESHEVE